MVHYNYPGVTGYNFNKKKYIEFLPLKIDFILAKSADPDEMPYNAIFHLGLHCLPEYSLMVSDHRRVNCLDSIITILFFSS